MKKFFTTMIAFVAIASGSFSAYAQNDDSYFKCYVDGNEVKDGDRIDITKFLDQQEFAGYGYYQRQYDTKLTMVAEAVGEMFCTITYSKNETPLTSDGLYGADFNVQFCGFGLCYNAYLGETIVNADAYTTKPGEVVYMQTELKLNQVTDESFTTIWLCGSAAPLEELEIKDEFEMKLTFEDQVMNLTFYVDQNGVGAGVEGIEADENAPVEYYDLQGRRVENPSNGLFIVKKGNKVSKQFVR